MTRRSGSGGEPSPPLCLLEQGHFWVGIQRAATPDGTYAHGQMFVQYQVPAERRHQYPVVMVHGGGQGLDYLRTPDGRPGWSELFVRAGFATYVVDLPGSGRAARASDPRHGAMPVTYEDIRTRFLGASQQWPGSGAVEDPALDQFMAGQRRSADDFATVHTAMQRCGVELLERIGPSVLLTHSMGGAFGWVVADQRPDLVRAIVAVEPVGPPFLTLPGPRGGLSWGVAAIPLRFDPPALVPDDLRREPAPTLPALADVPIAVVTGEASWMAQHDPETVAFLRRAGATVDHVRLGELGLHGNGHLMMLERNSAAIADVLIDWIAARLTRSAGGATRR